jgi:hypothetical protein
MRATLVAGILAALALGCGSAASAPPASPATTSLKISFWAEGKAASTPLTWTLRCDPPAGSLPRAADSCRRLKVMGKPFALPRARAACTQVYGGPQQATIAGIYLGQRVFASLAMNDGCQIARFKKLGFLVPGFTPGSPNS